MKTILLICLLGMLPAGGFADELRVPQGLEREVEFWQLIFGKYRGSECVLHDPERLDVIYGVIKLGRTRKVQKAKIRRYKRKIGDYLQRLAAGEPLKGVFASTLLRAVPGELHRGGFFAAAAKRIRCQKGNADGFAKSLRRSRKLLPHIKRKVRAYGLPEAIAYLPHVESGFNYRAYSKVGAAGLWQLMPASAREMGLKVNRWRDDRRSTRFSTDAALRILKRNYGLTGSWPLAITGYNYGINGMRRAVKKLGTKDYVKIRKLHRSAIFGFAAKNFYPSFLAAWSLAKEQEGEQISKGLLF